MSGQNDAKRDWISRVLGVAPGAGGLAPEAGGGAAALAAWRDAKEEVDRQIGALQRGFAAIDHPLAAAIADRGLAGLTSNLQVGLQAALFDFQAADGAGRDAAAAAVRQAAERLRRFLAEDKALPLLERNPFGVTFDIRASLGTALDRIEAAAS